MNEVVSENFEQLVPDFYQGLGTQDARDVPQEAVSQAKEELILKPEAALAKIIQQRAVPQAKVLIPKPEAALWLLCRTLLHR